MTEVSTKALDPKRVDEEEKELEQYQPSWEERRWLHVISLFFLVTLLFVGLPLWYLTTSTQQESLWIEKINTVSQHAINVAVDVVLLDANPQLSERDLEHLKQSLSFRSTDAQRQLDAQHSSHQVGGLADLPVHVDYRFHARDLTIDQSKHSSTGLSAEFEEAVLRTEAGERGSAGRPLYNPESAYFLVLLPHSFPGFVAPKTRESLSAIVRNSPERNLVYIRAPCPSAACVDKLTSTILALLENHLITPGKLQAIYQSVWWKGSDLDDLPHPSSASSEASYATIRSRLAATRTKQLPPSPGYEVTITLVSAFTEGNLPFTDDWLWIQNSPTSSSKGHSLGDWLAGSVEPGLEYLKQFINLNVYSQYLYSVSLEGILRGRLSKDRSHRYYSTTQLSSLLNSLEAYLGQPSSQRGQPREDVDGGRTSGTNGGLHFVIVVDNPSRSFNATQRKPVRFHLSGGGSGEPISVAVVPQWGAFISLDDIDVSLNNLGGVLVNAIRSFVGLPVRMEGVVDVSGGWVLFEPSSVQSGAAKWEIEAWLRSRTVESLSTVSLTLNSLLSTKARVTNLVINSGVSQRVQHAVEAWESSVKELASYPSSEAANRFSKAFISARIALEDADAAFFDQSLLDLLYFPSDQIFGIYLPLFAPIAVPVIMSAIGSLKFLKKGRPKPSD